MNREIKFRVLHDGEIYYVYGDQVELITTGNGFDLLLHEQYFETGSGIAEEYWRVKRYENPIIMQYTGFKDINDVEIYESDLIDVDGLRIPKNVYWDDGGYWALNFDSGASLSLIVNEGCEVVGNIHETPELIKV